MDTFDRIAIIGLIILGCLITFLVLVPYYNKLDERLRTIELRQLRSINGVMITNMGAYVIQIECRTNIYVP